MLMRLRKMLFMSIMVKVENCFLEYNVMFRIQYEIKGEKIYG